MAVTIDNLHKNFQGQPVLAGFHHVFATGQLTTLFGPNGCGKSTLLQMIAGLEKPDGGRIESAAITNRKVGYVWQDYRRSLLPWRNAGQNILLPLQLQGASDAQQKTALAELLQEVPVPFSLQQPVYRLSGGQAQLVCLLRALIINPELLLLDEPFSAIDYDTTRQLRQTLQQVVARRGLTTILVSHDLDEAITLGQHVLFLSRRPATIAHHMAIAAPLPREALWQTSDEYQVYKKHALQATTS